MSSLSSRRSFLQSSGVAVAAAGCAPILRAADTRPNIVFVLIDDLRWNALGSTGHPFVKTPNADRIAREGAAFENTFVTTPLCSPSRASFLTGRYVRSHGVVDNTNHNELSHQLVTWPRLLHDAGYETGYFGKWHMGNDDMPRPGFDRWVSFRGQGRYDDPPLNIDGKRVETSGYMTDLLNRHALDFLDQKRTKPFCLYLAHKAVHGPTIPAERHKQLYADERIDPPATWDDTFEGKPALAAARRPAGNNAWPQRAEQIRNQLRCLQSVDEGFGKILDALQTTGRLDDTLVVFTSDNGFFWGDHGLGDKRASYEPSIRIPMAVRYPKWIRPGRRVPQMALNIDFAPTMLEVAGVKPPAGVAGRSLVPLFKGAPRNWRKHFLIEYNQEPQNTRIPTWEGIRHERWKYTHYVNLEGQDELYDLASDAEEMHNLVNDPAARTQLAEMRKALADYRRELAAK